MLERSYRLQRSKVSSGATGQACTIARVCGTELKKEVDGALPQGVLLYAASIDRDMLHSTDWPGIAVPLRIAADYSPKHFLVLSLQSQVRHDKYHHLDVSDLHRNSYRVDATTVLFIYGTIH